MRKPMLAIVAAFMLIQPAVAADTSGRSPYDTNPACLDRSFDSTKVDCVIMDTGSPRQKYPPRIRNTPSDPARTLTPPAPAAREAAPPANRKGG